MAGRLDGRVAIVTGAGRGIAREVALLMAEEGASIVVADLGGAVDGAGSSTAPADQVVEEIHEAGGTAVSSYESVAEFETAGNIVRTAMESYGRIDILCHAAGVLRDRMIFNMTEEEWDTVLKVHLYGAFNMVRHTVPHMMEQGYGRILLFSSSSALGSTGQSNYSAAKEGIVGFARSLARELAPNGITANAVYPNANTRMTATVPEAARRMLRAREEATSEEAAGVSAVVAPGEPDEAQAAVNNAPKVVYLCTEAGGSITGQVVGTGGWSMSLYARRQATKSIHKDGRWTLDELERLIPFSLASGLSNPSPPEPPRQRPP